VAANGLYVVAYPPPILRLSSPDILGDDDRLTTTKRKPYWQEGWLSQHDRLIAAIAAMPGRIPLIVSGDLHALAEGRMLRSGSLDFGRIRS
jgi:hypothetical protein